MPILQKIRLNSANTNSQTSSVGEPSISNIGQQMLVTGNWYASKSGDNGSSWNHVDPFNFFPKADDGFCCDQTLHCDPSRNLTFWLLQYIKTNTGNTLRLAVNNRNTLPDNDWYWWDLVPSRINDQWQNEWFDYNHAAVSDNYLYVVTNVFSTVNNSFVRCVVFRFPLTALTDNGGNPGMQYFQTQNFSVRCTQGAGNTMYFASHLSDRKIRLFEWADNNPTASFTDINISPWVGGAGGYFAPGPDGNNWLSRCDPRITGGWISGDALGFMWSVDRTPSRPFPHVRCVRINRTTKQVISEPDIWSPNFAYAYPDTCPNETGDVGITLFRGGGNIYPGLVVGKWNSTANSWSLQAAQNGTNGPSDRKWGDYITCRRHTSDGNTWLAVGFTLQGGASRLNIEPCIVHFS